MKWTSEKPQPGFYWYRPPTEPPYTESDRDFDVPEILQVEDGLAYAFGFECGYSLDELKGEWAGPIEPPGEAE
jgi:hypothetical protein